LKVVTHGWDEVKGSFHRVVLVSSFVTKPSAAGQLKNGIRALIVIVLHFFTKFLSCLYFALTSFVLRCTLYEFIYLLILTLCLSFVLFRVACVG